MIRAGGKTIPYVAPVYNGYSEAIAGLKSQGLLAFFKGMGFRCVSAAVALSPIINSPVFIASEEVRNGMLYEYIKLCGWCLLYDFCCNPFHLL
jgi:hypothetical protein